jgi:hypothetical protein
MRGLAQQKEVVVEEGHLMPDHVHMLLSIDARPCAHVVIDPAEVFGICGGGVYQGEERDSDRASVHGSSEELCGAEFLGEGLLCIDGRSRRGTDPQIHLRARERR